METALYKYEAQAKYRAASRLQCILGYVVPPEVYCNYFTTANYFNAGNYFTPRTCTGSSCCLTLTAWSQNMQMELKWAGPHKMQSQ